MEKYWRDQEKRQNRNIETRGTSPDNFWFVEDVIIIVIDRIQRKKKIIVDGQHRLNDEVQGGWNSLPKIVGYHTFSKAHHMLYFRSNLHFVTTSRKPTNCMCPRWHVMVASLACPLRADFVDLHNCVGVRI